MDNRNRAPKFFGTPLSKCLEDESHSNPDLGPINRRRVRLERNQIVQDEQGRRRFHGAFTGGFSAGYYNTVDTVQGFQPKNFKSQRGSRGREDGSSSFDHRPEDYMDEEDFGEFGIAHKKVRLAGQFSTAGPSTGSNKSIVVNESIGEQILRSMTRNRRLANFDTSQPIVPKNDYHGLGYQSLDAKLSSAADLKAGSMHNPLVASLKSGMQLKITGEAFGDGVLEQDEDLDLHNTDEYGYDSIANYDFSQSKSSTTKHPMQQYKHAESRIHIDLDNSHSLVGFTLATDLESMELCDNECLKYPLPVIEEGWQMPVRTKPIIVPPDETELNRKNIDLYKNRLGSFNDRFTRSETGQSKLASDIEGRAGLVPYSDLKALVKDVKATETLPESTTLQSTSIVRRVVEWRPCSLLCKHFGVENPYPDNKFCGVRPSDLAINRESEPTQKDIVSEIRPSEDFAPLELRKSIFNVKFDDELGDCREQYLIADDEYEPQVVEIDSPGSGFGPENDEVVVPTTSNLPLGIEHEPEVVVVDVPKKEPEIIVLSSSDDSKSGRSSRASGSVDDDDAYGPPLPPSRQTLQDIERQSSSLRVSKSHKRKRHKKKSHKSKRKHADR